MKINRLTAPSVQLLPLRGICPTGRTELHYRGLSGAPPRKEMQTQAYATLKEGSIIVAKGKM